MKFGPGYERYLNQKGSYEFYSVPITGTSQPTIYHKDLEQISDPSKFYIAVSAGADIMIGKNNFLFELNYEYGKAQFDSFRSDIQLQIGFQF